MAVIAAGMAACGNGDAAAPDPCARAFACQVVGVDLVVEPLNFDWSANQPMHARTARKLVWPGQGVTLRYSVLNRGSEPSPATTLDLSIPGNVMAKAQIPSLEPGRRASGRLSFTVSAALLGIDAEFKARLDPATLLDSPYHQNDERYTPGFTPAVPFLVPELDAIASPVRAGSAMHLSYSLNNIGGVPFSDTVEYRFWNIDFGGPTFGGQQVIVPDGERRVIVHTLVVPHEAKPFGPFDAENNHLAVCPSGRNGRCSFQPVRVLADLEACQPVRIRADTTISGPLPEICKEFQSVGRSASVWSFEAEAGVRYRITSTGSAELTIMNRDGILFLRSAQNKEFGPFPVARYYLMASSTRPFTLHFTRSP